MERLGIDETRRGKANFRLTATGDGWEVVADRRHAGFVDLSGGSGLLGRIEGRAAAAVSTWIDAQTKQWRDGVRFVAIDPCTVLKAAVRASLPHATLVVDRFHVAQPAGTALTEVRRVTMQQRGRKGDREWEPRNRLTRSAARVHAKHLDPMVGDLKALPDKIGLPILAAWNAKEDLMDLLALTHTNPNQTQIAHLTAFGYRDPTNQRLRARRTTTRRSRGHLSTRTSGGHGQLR